MKYKDLPYGKEFYLGHDKYNKYRNGRFETFDRPIAWVKLSNGKAIMSYGNWSPDTFMIKFGHSIENGVNNGERTHGLSIYTQSDAKTSLTNALATVFTAIEYNCLEPFTTTCPTPKGYFKRFGNELSWTDVVSLPTESDIKDYANTGNIRYGTIPTCQGKSPGMIYCVRVQYNNSFLASRAVDDWINAYPVIRPNDDTELFDPSPTTTLEFGFRPQVQFEAPFPCELEEILFNRFAERIAS